MLRGIGRPQQRPGMQPCAYALQLAFYSTVPRRSGMRASAMSRVLRRIAMGKRRDLL